MTTLSTFTIALLMKKHSDYKGIRALLQALIGALTTNTSVQFVVPTSFYSLTLQLASNYQEEQVRLETQTGSTILVSLDGQWRGSILQGQTGLT